LQILNSFFSLQVLKRPVVSEHREEIVFIEPSLSLFQKVYSSPFSTSIVAQQSLESKSVDDELTMLQVILLYYIACFAQFLFLICSGFITGSKVQSTSTKEFLREAVSISGQFGSGVLTIL
jgi:hypothetical protein